MYFFLAAGNTAEVQYRVDKVSRGDIQMVVTATGTLSAVTTVQKKLMGQTHLNTVLVSANKNTVVIP